jgi:hypothetical protein
MVTTAHQNPVERAPQTSIGAWVGHMVASLRGASKPAEIKTPPAQPSAPKTNQHDYQLLLENLQQMAVDDPARRRVENAIAEQQKRMQKPSEEKPSREQALQALLQTDKRKALLRDLGGKADGKATAPKKPIDPQKLAAARAAKRAAEAKVAKIARGQELNTAGGMAAERNAAQSISQDAKVGKAAQAEARKAMAKVDAEAASRAQHRSADPQQNLNAAKAKEQAPTTKHQGGPRRDAAAAHRLAAARLGQTTRS